MMAVKHILKPLFSEFKTKFCVNSYSFQFDGRISPTEETAATSIIYMYIQYMLYIVLYYSNVKPPIIK